MSLHARGPNALSYCSVKLVTPVSEYPNILIKGGNFFFKIYIFFNPCEFMQVDNEQFTDQQQNFTRSPVGSGAGGIIRQCIFCVGIKI